MTYRGSRVARFAASTNAVSVSSMSPMNGSSRIRGTQSCSTGGRRRVFVRCPKSDSLADVEGWLGDEAWLVVAAMEEDRLLGYASAWAVEDAAYLHTYAFLEETKRDKLGLSAVLNVAMVMVLQRAKTICTVSPGIAEPEHGGAMAHKIGQGFPIVEIPARLMLPWPAARYLRKAKPNAYYRLTGAPPPSGVPVATP